MYLPGARELLLFAAALVLVLAAVALRAPAILVLAASTAMTYLTLRHGLRLLELVYGDRVLLLKHVDIELREDPRGVRYMVIRRGRAVEYAALLRVKDYDPSQRLGRAAERAVAALHHPGARVGVIAVLREGGYDYYIRITARDIRGLRLAVGDLMRQLLAAGVHVSPADAVEVLEALGSIGGELKPIAPLFTFSAIAVGISALFVPHLLALMPPLLILAHYEFRMRGSAAFIPRRAVKLAYAGLGADEAMASSLVRSVFALARVAPAGSFIVANLSPVDAGLLEAKVRAAMEVLDAARVGAGRLRDELRAARWLSIFRRLQEGAAPFRCIAVASPELARELSTAGLRVSTASRLEILSAILGLDSRGDVFVSHQLTWLAPQAFLRPRTRRTPKACLLYTSPSPRDRG